MAKYSKRFVEDFKWFLSVRHAFSFDGRLDKYDIEFDIHGVNAMDAFLKLDAYGKIVPTKHPNILKSLIKTKGSVNLHIKMYAEDRAKGILPKILFNDIIEEYKAPTWFVDAVENQKNKYY